MATAAAVALYFYDCQTVVRILADAVESGEQTLVDFLGDIGCFEHQRLGLSLGLSKDLVEFRTLLVQINRALLDGLGSCCFFLQTLFQFRREMFDLALRSLDLQLLVFDFLVQVVELAVVTNGILLLFVALCMMLRLSRPVRAAMLSIGVMLTAIIMAFLLIIKKDSPDTDSLLYVFVIFSVIFALLTLAYLAIEFIITVKLNLRLAKVFGKGTGFALGLTFISIVFYPVLAFGKAQRVRADE